MVDTVSHVNRTWSGIHMAGPYVWRPPYYWFSDKYGPARGSSAEEGDNETIPPVESLKKFIPAEKLWPINEYWYFHAGANEGNNTLENIQRVIDKRYGPSSSVEEFSKKAQLAHYEDVRAQYETYSVQWADRKMMVHWMMNNPWPSFFGHLFDDFMKQGGGYFGAEKRPVPDKCGMELLRFGRPEHGEIVRCEPDIQGAERLNSLVGVFRSRRETKVLQGSERFQHWAKHFGECDDDWPHCGDSLDLSYERHVEEWR